MNYTQKSILSSPKKTTKAGIPSPSKTSIKLIKKKIEFEPQSQVSSGISDSPSKIEYTYPMKSYVRLHNAVPVKFSANNKLPKSQTLIKSNFQKQESKNMKKMEELYLKLRELKNDLTLFRKIYDSLKSVAKQLHEPLHVSSNVELSLNQMISQTDRSALEFYEIFTEFENAIAASELVLKSDMNALSEHLQKASTCREQLVSKVLTVYDNTVQTLASFIEVIRNNHYSTLMANHETLKDKLECLQTSLLLRETKIQNLQKELTISQEKVKSQTSEIKSLDEQNHDLIGELEAKNSKIEQLTLQLYRKQLEAKGMVENEKLIKVIEEIKENADLEKNALKKALKVQKQKGERWTVTLTQLQDCIDQKEHKILELGADRDRWKMKVTALNNQLVDANERICKLEKDLLELQHTQEQTFGEIVSKVEEKSSIIGELMEEKDKLHNVVNQAERCYSSSEKKIKMLEEQYAKLESKLEIQDNIESSKTIPTLIPLFQDLKETLAIIRDNTHLAAKSESKVEKLSEEKLLGIVKEIKDLIETKDLNQSLTEENKKNKKIILLENKIQELEAKLNEKCSKRETLSSNKLDKYLSSSKSRRDKIDLDLKSLTLETGDNSNLSDIENQLRKTNIEIAALKRKNMELESMYQSEVRDLKSDYDRVTANYESLQKYIEMLNSSYSNVFGQNLAYKL